MKSKKILITYFDNGDFADIIKREILIEKIKNELVEEGRVFYSTSTTNKFKTIRFKDGTQIQMMPFGRHSVGMRVTHLYIDESIMEIDEANKAVLNCYIGVVVSEDYMNWDTSGDRIFTYGKNGETTILKTLKDE